MSIAKYSMGQKVYVYANGKLRAKVIKEIIAVQTDKIKVEYLFDGDSFRPFSRYGTDEVDVFESRDHFIEAIKNSTDD